MRAYGIDVKAYASDSSIENRETITPSFKPFTAMLQFIMCDDDTFFPRYADPP
jgi:hypothetical protein